jgi:hypothetical protein
MRKAVLIALAVMVLSGVALAAESKVAADILAKHRAAIGTDDTRASVRTRVAEGTTRYEVLSGGAGTIEGKATVVSAGVNSRYVMKFKNPDYPGEDLLTNGNKVQVYGMPKRSMLGELLYVHDSLLREGIFSGALSTGWPLLDPQLRGSKLDYGGRKTINGAELDEILYLPKKRSDVEMKLYFEPTTGRHVLTVATLTIEPRLIGSETSSPDQQTVRYRMEQRFSDFREFDGITLPTNCSTLLIADGYRSVQLRYSSKFENIQHNIELDPKNFQLK